jgi:hypothetical protein
VNSARAAELRARCMRKLASNPEHTSAEVSQAILRELSAVEGDDKDDARDPHRSWLLTQMTTLPGVARASRRFANAERQRRLAVLTRPLPVCEELKLRPGESVELRAICDGHVCITALVARCTSEFGPLSLFLTIADVDGQVGHESKIELRPNSPHIEHFFAPRHGLQNLTFVCKQDLASALPLDELVLRDLTLQTPLAFMSNHAERQLVPGRPGIVIDAGGADHPGP